MQRKELKSASEQRMSFIATFGRYGRKRGYGGREEKTLLLLDVLFADGRPACDHIWFTCGKSWDEASCDPGDTVTFDARVKRYEKGYAGYRDDIYKPISTDYKLSHPTKIQKVPK